MMDIEKLAREAGAGFEESFESVGSNPMWLMTPEELRRFARLLSEEDAKLCEAIPSYSWASGSDQFGSACPVKVRATPQTCAAAIRERFKAEP